MAALEGAGAVQLHSGVHDVLRGLGREQLRHRRAPAIRPVRPRRTPRPPRRPAGGRPRCGWPSRRPGARPTGGPSAGRRTRSRGRRVVERRVQGRLCHADGEGADAGAEEVEGVHGDAEAAVRLRRGRRPRDTGTASKVRAPMGCGESMSIGDAGQSRAVGGDEEGGDSARSGVRRPYGRRRCRSRPRGRWRSSVSRRSAAIRRRPVRPAGRALRHRNRRPAR